MKSIFKGPHKFASKSLWDSFHQKKKYISVKCKGHCSSRFLYGGDNSRRNFFGLRTLNSPTHIISNELLTIQIPIIPLVFSGLSSLFFLREKFPVIIASPLTFFHNLPTKLRPLFHQLHEYWAELHSRLKLIKFTSHAEKITKYQ